MADERIEVEYIATQQQVLGAFEKLNRRLDATEKKLEKTGTTSKKAAKLAEGSFAALEKELKDNEAALKRMAIGTAEFEKQRAKVDRLRRSLKGAKGELGGVTERASAISQAGSMVLSKVVGLGAGLATVGTVVSGLRAELENIQTIRMESARVVTTREQAMAALANNVSPDQIDDLQDRIEAVAASTSLKFEDVAGVASIAASAGAGSNQNIMEASVLALQSQGGDQAAGQAVVGALLDTAKSMQISVKDALGILLQSQGSARITDITKLAREQNAAVKALTLGGKERGGFGAESAAELFVAATQVTGDADGARAKQAVIDLGRLLDSATLDPETIGPIVAAKFRQGTAEERLKLAAGDSTIQQQLLKQAPDSLSTPFIKEALTGSAAFTTELRKAREAIEIQTAGQRATQQLDVVTGSTAVSNLGKLIENQLEAARANRVEALEGLATQGFTTFLEKTNASGLDIIRDPRLEAAAQAREFLGEGVAEARGNLLRQRADEFSSVGDQQAARNTGTVLNAVQELIDQLKQNEVTNAEAARRQAALETLLRNRLAPPGAQAANRPKEAPLPAATLP